MTLNWTSGGGARRLVLAHALTPISANPASGSGYTASANFISGSQIGSGNYVVYDGTGSSVALTGLSPTTTFYFQVYEYNGSAGTQNYNVSAAANNPNSQATVTGPPTIQATNIVFSSVNNSQMTLSCILVRMSRAMYAM